MHYDAYCMYGATYENSNWSHQIPCEMSIRMVYCLPNLQDENINGIYVGYLAQIGQIHELNISEF